MTGAMSEKACQYPEVANIRQVCRTRREFVMADACDVPTTERYDLTLEIDFRGTTYNRDPEHEHEPVDDAGAYALVWRLGRPLWRGYSDGWEAIRAMDAVQSGHFEVNGYGECAPEAVVDREGRVRWMRP